MRLEGRGNFDDQKEAIKKRIDNYNEGTKPVIAAYSKLVQTVSFFLLVILVISVILVLVGKLGLATTMRAPRPLYKPTQSLYKL